MRNAYDLVWHCNGQLYVPTNGSAAGGNTPATPTPLPAAARTASTAGRTAPTPARRCRASTPSASRTTSSSGSSAGGYYGHPNPVRCEWVLNGGNPTSGTDTAQVTAYPVGTQPDRN